MPYNSLVSRTDTAALVPEEVSSAMLTSLSEQSAVLELGQKIPMARNQTRFPVLSALPTAYFVSGDTGLKQTTEAAWDNKYGRSRRVGITHDTNIDESNWCKCPCHSTWRNDGLDCTCCHPLHPFRDKYQS